MAVGAPPRQGLRARRPGPRRPRGPRLPRRPRRRPRRRDRRHRRPPPGAARPHRPRPRRLPGRRLLPPGQPELQDAVDLAWRDYGTLAVLGRAKRDSQTLPFLMPISGSAITSLGVGSSANPAPSPPPPAPRSSSAPSRPARPRSAASAPPPTPTAPLDLPHPRQGPHLPPLTCPARDQAAGGRINKQAPPTRGRTAYLHGQGPHSEVEANAQLWITAVIHSCRSGDVLGGGAAVSGAWDFSMT